MAPLFPLPLATNASSKVLGLQIAEGGSWESGYMLVSASEKLEAFLRSGL